MQAELRKLNLKKRPAQAPVTVDQDVDWRNRHRLTASVARNRRAPFSLDITSSSAFLHNGSTSYTFGPPDSIHAGQIFTETHVDYENLPATDPTLQAADEHVKHRTRFPSDDRAKVWRDRCCNPYLGEFMRLESARGSACPGVPGRPCSDTAGVYECLTCTDVRLYCLECTLYHHADQYLHIIQQWHGEYFWPTTLAAMGLVIQLGHPPRQPCMNPRPSNAKYFMVFDSDYVHKVNMNFCDCELATVSRDIQLLRHRLYPASSVDPETCATFRSLEYFQMLTFMSKVSAYEYFYTACRLTDNTGTCTPPDRYQIFLGMVRQWRHLKMCKRFGIVNRPTGRESLTKGDLVVECPACPRPGVNVDTQEDFGLSQQLGISPSPRWTNRFFAAIDANFRLQRSNVSSTERDPPLNAGAAYFVEQTAFDAHIEKFGGSIPDEQSTCSQHDALKLASKRGGKGTACSGVGAVVCSRHDMKRGSGAINLKKGEKYVYMDYAVLSTLGLNTPDDLVISYDIACQWSKKLVWRITMYGDPLRPRQNMRFALYLVPKFHLPGHVLICRALYSFNRTPHVGRTDGEAPERGWARDDPAAASTKEMGPGSRLDTLEDHFGDSNWRKVCLMPSALLEKLKEAVEQREEKVISFLGLEASLEKADVVPEWRSMVLKWESDPFAKDVVNPYLPTLRTPSDHAVRLRLAEEEAQNPNVNFVKHTVGPSDFVIQGLQLEELQVKAHREYQRLGPHATHLQRTRVQETLNRLTRRIEAWREIQGVYMPAATVRRMEADGESSNVSESAYDMELHLPSSMSRLLTPLDFALAAVEYQLRVARAEDSLAQLRNHILLRASMYRVKERQVRGQKLSGRANTLLQQVTTHIKDDADRYRSHYQALIYLDKFMVDHSWSTSLKVLEDKDIRNIDESDGSDNRHGSTSEGRRMFSWIWTTAVDTTAGGKEMQEALRIEWCKARSRAQRWQEECVLLRVEMRRVLATFQHDALEWDRRALMPGVSEAVHIDGFVQGIQAYARRQAAIRRKMLDNAKRLFEKAPLDALASVGDTGDPAKDFVDVTQDLDCVVDIES